MSLKHSGKIICPDCGKETTTVSLEDFIRDRDTDPVETIRIMMTDKEFVICESCEHCEAELLLTYSKPVLKDKDVYFDVAVEEYR